MEHFLVMRSEMTGKEGAAYMEERGCLYLYIGIGLRSLGAHGKEAAWVDCLDRYSHDHLTAQAGVYTVNHSTILVSFTEIFGK
ncbi:hypothetical protein [Candidimonas nitroreducens]|uniref:hypothetical protein n=1 Tax=Candidimonas nitroreducens TaxID=683354 RepID=UPI0011789E76|nr:hypothetical protein [Candidimonas nitroreducens]